MALNFKESFVRSLRCSIHLIAFCNIPLIALYLGSSADEPLLSVYKRPILGDRQIQPLLFKSVDGGMLLLRRFT